MKNILIRILKKIPIDFGQQSVAHKTKGKLIAQSLVPEPRPNYDDHALDVGCRAGVQSRWLEDKGYRVTAIDIDKKYDSCQVVDVNQGLPFADQSFDLLWCSEVIEHLDSPADAISEFSRVVKRGGRVLLTTPNSFFWLFRLFSLFGLPPKQLQRQDHLHFFNLRDIQILCPAAEVFGYFPYTVLKFKIKRDWMVRLLSPTFVVLMEKPSACKESSSA